MVWKLWGKTVKTIKSAETSQYTETQKTSHGVRKEIIRITYNPGQAVRRTPASLGISRPRESTIQDSGAEIREGVVRLQTQNLLDHEVKRKHVVHNIKGRDHTLTASFTPRRALVGAILVR